MSDKLRALLEEKIHQIAGLIYKETGQHGLLKIKLSDAVSRAIGLAGDVEYATAAGPVLVIGGPEAATPVESPSGRTLTRTEERRLERRTVGNIVVGSVSATVIQPSGRYRFDETRARSPGGVRTSNGWIDTGDGSEYSGPCECGSRDCGPLTVPPDRLRDPPTPQPADPPPF